MSKRPTIVLFSAFYEPWMSGAERFVKEVVERLSSRYDFVIVTARLSLSVPAIEKRDGFSIRRVGFGRPWDKWIYPILAPLAAWRIRPTVAHAVMESYAGIALWLFGWIRPSCKRVLTLQSGDLDSEKKQKNIPGWLWNRIHKTPDIVTAISGFLAQRVRKMGVSVPRSPIIPNGVDLSRVKPRDPSRRVPHRIVMIARLSWEKAHVDVLNALVEVRKTFEDAHLVLIGEGVLRQELEQKTRDLGINGVVDFRGNLENSVAMELAGTADVFVCPSLAEGLGIVFIEAQALGLPVIGSNVGGIPDVIQHEKTGLLVPPKNSDELAKAIVRLMSDRPFADRLTKQALANIQRFDWKTVVEQVAQVYDRVANEKRLTIVTGIYPPDAGGPASYARTVARALMKDGHLVTVLTYGDDRTEPGDGWSVRTVSRMLPLPLRYAGMVLRLLSVGRNADGLLVLDTVSVGLPATIANILLRKRLTVRVVGDYAWEQGRARFGVTDSLDEFQGRTYSDAVERMRRVQRFVLRRASAIVTPAEYLAKILSGWNLGVVPVTVVPNAVDAPLADRPIAPTGDTKLLLSIARLTPWKGMVELVEAFATVHAEIPEARLRIIGDGLERSHILDTISRLKLDSVVDVMHTIPHEEIFSWYGKAYGFILNTGYEGLSHQILEALAMGLPVATTSAGGNVEIIQDGKNGRFFPVNNREAMADAMRELLTNRDVVLARAQTGIDQMRSWTQEQMARRALEIAVGGRSDGRRHAPSGAGARVLLITLDNSVLEEGSATARRMVRYEELTERLDVIVLADGTYQSRQLSSRVSVIRPGGLTRVDAWIRAWFIAFWRSWRKRSTIVDAQDPFFAGAIGWSVARIVGASFLLEVHGDFWTEQRPYRVKGLRATLATFLVYYADRIRLVSQRVERHVRQTFPELEPSRLFRFPLATPEPSVMSDQTKPRRTADGTYALFVGHLGKEKGLDIFLPAFANVVREIPSLRLWIVGEGSERGALQEQVRSLGIDPNVFFIGQVSDPTAYFATADFLVLPSRHESWARVVIEGFAQDLPVLMTDVGCAGEIVENEKHGLIVSVDDPFGMERALRRLTTDVDFRQKMRDNIKELIPSLPRFETTFEGFRSFWNIL